MVLYNNSGPDVIITLVNIVDFPEGHGPNESIVHKCQYFTRWQPRHQVSAWPINGKGAVDMDPDPECSRPKHSPLAIVWDWIIPWPQVTAWATHVCITPATAYP